MKVKFTAEFGTHKPGDELDLPDGAKYDRSYLVEVHDEEVPVSAPVAEDGDK